LKTVIRREKIKAITSNHFKLLVSIVIFVVVVLAIWLPRIGIPYLHDDTLAVAWIANDLIPNEDPALLTELPNHSDLIRSGFASVWIDTGERLSPYRPFEQLYSLQLLFWPYNPLIPMLFHSMVLGATATLIFLLVFEITAKKLVAIGSALFYAFAVPSLVGSWLVLHPQPYTNLFIALGLLAYVYYKKSKKFRYLIIFWVAAILAPFFRELTYILSFTVLSILVIEMITERKWNKPLLISTPLLAFHAAFPSFLPNILMSGEVVLNSQYRGGFAALVPMELGPELISSIMSHYEHMAFSMPYQLATFIPPLITVLALSGVALFGFRNRKLIDNGLLNILLSITVVLIAVALVGLTSLVIQQFVLSLALFLLVLVSGFRFGKLLPIWLAVAGLPFILIFNGHDLHIWPASIPWIVIILLWVDYLVCTIRDRISSAHRPRMPAKLGYLVIVFMLLIAVVDQGLNIVAVRTVWQSIGSGVEEMGEYLRSSPKGSMVVGNFNHTVDIEYFAHGNVKHYITMPWRGYMTGRVLVEESNFEKAVDKHLPETDVFLLAETGTVYNPPNKYVDNPPGELVLETKFIVHSKYYFADPLKNLLPSRYWKKTAPPDLLYSYVLNGGPFFNEYTQSYSLYRLVTYDPSINNIE